MHLQRGIRGPANRPTILVLHPPHKTLCTRKLQAKQKGSIACKPDVQSVHPAAVSLVHAHKHLSLGSSHIRHGSRHMCVVPDAPAKGARIFCEPGNHTQHHKHSLAPCGSPMNSQVSPRSQKRQTHTAHSPTYTIFKLSHIVATYTPTRNPSQHTYTQLVLENRATPP